MTKIALDQHIDYYIKYKLNYGDYRIWNEYRDLFLAAGKIDFFNSLNWIVGDVKYEASQTGLGLSQDELIEIINARLANLRADGTMRELHN